MALSENDRELLGIVLDDLKHIQKESNPECSDHQLRRISVQLRGLLVEDRLFRAWRTLGLQPKAPAIIAQRLRTDHLDENALAVAAGGQIGGASIAGVQFMPGVVATPEDAKRMYEQGKADLEYKFSLSEYKDSCAIFVKGKRVKRVQLVKYVANKKGGAHLDASRKDEEIYSLLDAAGENLVFGGTKSDSINVPGKNAIYLELLSIGQNVSSAPDIQRLMTECANALTAQ